MYPLDDTICAVASPPGGAARGIVRLSGPRVREILGACFRPAGRGELPAVVRAEAVAGSLRLAGMASPLPCDAYLWPQRRSYTGQAVAEIHTLGSRPLLQAVLHGLCAAGARVAQPGEFTLRAFLAGRLDLTQAEAVLGVIDAADPGQLGVALAQLAGGLAGPLDRLRDGLVDLLAHLEAGFDFAHEDLPFITAEELTAQLGEAAERVAQLCRQMSSRGEAAPTVRAVLVGWPNVGKSSLFNALTHHAGALVSEHPGTTRDYLTAELDLGGVKCQLIDTAGMGPEPDGPENAAAATHSIEEAARAVSSQQSRRAHVRILCLESTRPPNDWERSPLQQTAGGPHVVVLTKIDLGNAAEKWCDAASPEAVPSATPRKALPADKQWHTADPKPTPQMALGCDGDLPRAVP
ncbi:MAG: tRNA modification GTPase, partial [Planctomycetota bacterium]